MALLASVIDASPTCMYVGSKRLGCDVVLAFSNLTLSIRKLQAMSGD